MKFHVNPVTDNAGDFHPYVPDSLKKYAISFAKAQFYRDHLGAVLEQEIVTNHFTVWLVFFDSVKRISRQVVTDRPMIVLQCMLEGEMYCEIKGVEKILQVVPQCQLLYLPKGTHLLHLNKGNNFVCYFDISPELLLMIEWRSLWAFKMRKKMTGSSDTAMCVPGPADHMIVKILSRVFNGELNRRELENELEAHMLTLLFRATGENSSDNEHQRFLKTILKYINEQIDDPDLCVTNLSTHFNLSVKTLERLFNSGLGCSPSNYIYTQRMKRGMQLLIDTAQPVKAVCYDVGYMSGASFIRAFKRYFHYSPGYVRDHPEQFSNVFD